MAQKKKKRKTRVTKEDIQKMRKERNITSYQRKKIIIPGPWTNMNTNLEINVSLRKNISDVVSQILGPAFGSYTKDGAGQRGWYSIVFNIESDDMKEIISRYGMDQFLAASEKSLNKQVDKNKKPKYGTIIITQMCVDNSQREDKSRRFISCNGKTNKKNITGFRVIVNRKLITL